jgi:hypothetical protein
VIIFGFYLGGFVVNVCFLFVMVFLGVVWKEGESGSKVAFYVSALQYGFFVKKCVTWCFFAIFLIRLMFILHMVDGGLLLCVYLCFLQLGCYFLFCICG